jgi:hypothetical protein
METTTLRKTKRILGFEIKKEKRAFLVINILLVIGLITIVSTLLYILINLEQSDRIILRCLPIIVLGLVFVLSYAIGYNKLTAKENKGRPFKIQFMEKFKLK